MPGRLLTLHSSAGLYGADVQLLAIARGLGDRGWQVTCVLPERGELASELEGAAAEVVVHPLAVLRRSLATPAGAARLTRGLRRDARVLADLARQRGITVVHSNTSVVLSGDAIARRAGVAHVLHVREIWSGALGPLGSALWPLMRHRLLRADALACISEAVLAQFSGSRRAHIVRDGLPHTPAPPAREEARRELGVPAETFAVALVGRVSDWKGQDVLARALAEPALADIGAVGIVAGDAVPGSDEEHRLAELAASLGLGDRLLRVGFRRDVDTVLGAADALAVPSKRPEPLGLVALEAAAAGLPVVASATGGVAEVVREGVSGTQVPPDDPGALAGALRALADDPRRARAFGEAGARDVAERFSLERMLDELEALLERVARRD